MKIRYQGHRTNLKEAVRVANKLLRYQPFFDQISKHEGFDMANIPGSQIAQLIQRSRITMSIAFYYSMSSRSKALSFDDLKNPNMIRLNVWQIDRPVASLCNTMIHMCIHAVNAENPTCSFGHDKEGDVKNTAPYWIGMLAQKMIAGDEYINDYMQHETSYDALDIFECLILPVN